MKSKNLLLKRMANFYNDIFEERNTNQEVCLQID